MTCKDIGSERVVLDTNKPEFLTFLPCMRTDYSELEFV